MSITQTRSIQLTPPTAGQNPSIRLYPIENYGKRRAQSFEIPVGNTNLAGDAGSTIELVRLPIGRFRILPAESKFWCSAGGAGITMQIGIRAYYYQQAGLQLQADDPTVLSNGAAIDVSAALNNTPFNAAVWKYDLFPTQGYPQAGLTSGVPAGAVGPNVFLTFPAGLPAGFAIRGRVELIAE